jgi:hypothetical protein
MNQYVFLIYQGGSPLPGTPEWDALPEDEQKRIYKDYADLNKTPGLTPGLPLGSISDARTVQVVGGDAVTTDGPWVDEKIAVGGYTVFEAETLDEAIEVAGRFPPARHGGAVEVRQVGVYW